MINTIIFDIGQVLAHFRWHEYIEELGFRGDDADRLARATVLGPYWDEVDRGVMTMKQIIEKCISCDEDIEEAIRLFFKDRRNLVVEFDYSEELLKKLKEQGYRILLLSNYGEENFDYVKNIFKFMKYVDGMVISYQIKHIKPEPAIYETLIQNYRLEPSECVFLDDNLNNVNAARELGINAIHFTDYEKAMKELKDKYNVSVD